MHLLSPNVKVKIESSDKYTLQITGGPGNIYEGMIF
jgi:hypothetical protein